jgi:hypothetical protein
MSARLSEGPPLTIESRDTLFSNDFLAAPNSVNYDVFPDGKSFVMLRRLGGASGGVAASIVVIMNWRPGRD